MKSDRIDISKSSTQRYGVFFFEWTEASGGIFEWLISNFSSHNYYLRFEVFFDVSRNHSMTKDSSVTCNEKNILFFLKSGSLPYFLCWVQLLFDKSQIPAMINGNVFRWQSVKMINFVSSKKWPSNAFLMDFQ